MVCNVGKTDKVIRVVVGVALIVWAITSGNILGYIGIILVITSIIGFCPLYTLLGINTGCDIKRG